MDEWASMPWQSIAKTGEDGPVVILPVGCVETQGPYTPVGLEYVLADRIAKDVAMRVGGLALPCIPYGNSDAFQQFPGTIYIRPEVLTMLYEDVIRSVIRSGFNKILCIVCHVPNQPLIERAARSVREVTGVRIVWMNPGSLAGTMLSDYFDDVQMVRGHGAEPGSSLARYLFNTQIAGESHHVKARHQFEGFGVEGGSLHVDGVPIGYPLMWEDLYAENGGYGDPTQGSREIGQHIFDRLVDAAVRVAEIMHTNSVE